MDIEKLEQELIEWRDADAENRAALVLMKLGEDAQKPAWAFCRGNGDNIMHLLLGTMCVVDDFAEIVKDAVKIYDKYQNDNALNTINRLSEINGESQHKNI